jgi:hypothetical protein
MIASATLQLAINPKKSSKFKRYPLIINTTSIFFTKYKLCIRIEKVILNHSSFLPLNNIASYNNLAWSHKESHYSSSFIQTRSILGNYYPANPMVMESIYLKTEFLKAILQPIKEMDLELSLRSISLNTRGTTKMTQEMGLEFIFGYLILFYCKGWWIEIQRALVE